VKRKERIDRGIKARCDDIYALLSLKEISYVVAPKICFVLFIVAFPLFKGAVGYYWERVFYITCLMAILSISWELLSYVGLISLGQAFIFGTGAYTSAILNFKFHFPALLSILFASGLGALICTLILFPASKIRGIYFAMITLCIPMFFSKVIEATELLGGTSGINGICPIKNYYVEMYLAVLVLLGSFFSLRRLMSTDFGLLVRGIKDNEFSLMSSGINIHKIKFFVIFLASAMGSFSGACMCHYYQFVGISAFSLDYSIIPLACSILGGIDGLAGSLAGAFIICPLSEILRGFGTLRIVIYSTLLIVFILTVPEGIFSYVSRKYHQIERWKEI